MTPSDDEILRRVQRGDRDAFIVLFDRYHSRVEGYARRQMQNPEAARDIASETFLRAYRTVDNFRIGEISYAGYLYLICRRLMLTERTRSSGIHLRSLDEEPGEMEDLPDRVPLPLDMLLAAERCDMIREALNRLPDTDREIIHLAFDHDLSRRDISAILSKPSVTAVTSHLHRAIQKLKAIIAEQGYFENRRDGEQRPKHAAR